MPASNSSDEAKTLTEQEKETVLGRDDELHSKIEVDEEAAVAASSVAAPSKNVAPEFIEGGLRGWLNVLGAFIMLFVSFGFTNGFGVLQAYYALERYPNETPSSISWIGSIQLCLIFCSGSVVGPLYDKGYFRVLVTFGSILYIFSFFMTSLCNQFWQTLLAQGLGLGIASGCLFLPSVSIISQNFQKRRSFAMGIATAGSSVGGVIFPIFLRELLGKESFGSAFRAPGYMVAGLLVLANAIMSFNPNLVPKGARPPAPNPLTFFKEIRYLAGGIGAFCIALAIFIPIFFLPQVATRNGVDDNIAFYSISILNAASIFGRTLPNAVADRVGPSNVLIVVCSVTSALIWALFGAKSTGAVIVFAILYGFFSGAYVSLVGPYFVSMSNSPSEIGVRIGVAFSCVGIAALIGTPIAGQLLIRTPDFSSPIIFAGVVSAFGCVCFVFSRIDQAKRKGTWKV